MEVVEWVRGTQMGTVTIRLRRRIVADGYRGREVLRDDCRDFGSAVSLPSV